jgi:hypothetical protein
LLSAARPAPASPDLSPTSTRPAQSPSSGVDPNTIDLLEEIESTTAPARSGPTAAAEDHPARPAAAPSRLGDWLHLTRLFAPALVTAAAVGIAGGVVGTFVLLRREGMVALALPQVVAVGAAVGMREGWPTLPPALATAGAALLFLVLSNRRGAGAWALPALYVAGLSFSFLLIANRGQDVAELQNLFTGVEVAVAPAEAWLSTPLLLLTALACAALWRRWLLERV